MLTDVVQGANLKCLHASLDDRGKDRFTLIGVCKHVRDLVQQAAEEGTGGLWVVQGVSTAVK